MMKKLNKHPLSMLAILMLVLLSTTCIYAQTLTLVKDINTSAFADLKNALVYSVGNKIYYSDGTANGTKVAYTGAANATILPTTALPNTSQLAYFFIERTPTSAKALRYNKARMDVLTEGATITDFVEQYGVFRYVVNGNQLWTATYNTGPKLIRTFSTPIKTIVDNTLATSNSVWTIDYALGTATLTKDGFSEIGEFAGYRFAANDGGFNGTELWTIGSPTNAYLVQDLNSGTASSNPRNFFSNTFTATSGGQNWIYQFDFTAPKRLISAPIGTELKVLSYFFGYSQYGQSTQFLVYTEKTGSTFHVFAAQVDTPSFRRQIYGGTEGDIVFNSNVSNVFTHIHSNGTRDIWQFVNYNNAELIVPNASLDNMYGGLQFVAGDDGKLWRIDNINQFYNRTLIKDFGAAKLQIQGVLSTSAPLTYRAELIITSTTNGNTTTHALDRAVNEPSTIRDVSTINLPASDYSSNPNAFVEINDKILFIATDGERGEELWRTDGTTAGTTLFKEFAEGVYGSVGKSYKENGFVYYANTNFSGNYTTYWKTDGTTIDSIRSTTAEYQTIRNKFNQGQNYPNLTIGNAKYQTYYSVYSLCSRCPSAFIGGIQRILGTDTSFVVSFNYVSSGASAINSLQALGNKFYFTFHQELTGSNSDKRGALWASDGTAAGTSIVKTFITRPSDIVVINNKLYFTADDGINGLALWTSDGTAAGTNVVANFNTPAPIPYNFEVSKIYVQGNSLYFIISQLFTGNSTSLQAYRIGGNGIVKIMDLTNEYYALAAGAIQVNDHLYLAQTRSDVGTELFKISLPEAPLGTPLSNVSDLSLSQTIVQTRTPDTLFLDIALSVRNNGSQTATNVKTSFPSFTSFGLFNINSDAPLRDTIISTGFLLENYSTWFVPSLGVNQTATFRYRLVIPKAYIQRKILRTTVKSDQFDGNAANNFAEYPIELTASCSEPVTGSLLVDYYNDQVTDASPIVIQNPNAPSGSYLTNGAVAFSFGEQYIRRARGYLLPTESGNYRFYIAGDDNVDVYLSTDDNPANKRRIAYVQGYTSLAEFNKYPSQTSNLINLTAGRRYYVEIVNAEKFGDDLFNLQWTTPSVSARSVIASAQVESFCGDPVVALPDLTSSNLNITTPSVQQGQNLNFTFDAKNIGTANATSPFTIKSYLSTDQTLDANDYQNGSIPTANYIADAHVTQIQGALNVLNTVPIGNYYLILKIDADNQIAESNEANNVIVSTNLITVTTPSVGINDIVLSLTSTPSVYRQYSTQNFKISAKNTGNQAFTNVKIDFPFPTKTVNGGTVVPSIGTWQEYCSGGTRCFTWTMPTLAANTTATLDVPLYVLDVLNTLTATTHLLSSNPVDNNTANNTASVTINSNNTPLIQPLIQSKPTQLIPVIIQKISPTITENYIIIELESIVDKQIDFQIINSLGNTVLMEKKIIEKGNNSVNFGVENLPQGMYFIQTSVGKGHNVPIKFIKF